MVPKSQDQGRPVDVPPEPRRWAVAEERDAVRVLMWGAVGAAETAAVDARLAETAPRAVPVVVDLTGATDLQVPAVTWLGERHREFGHERPLLVVVVADGHVHERLTRPEAPRLRLTLT
jgi:hypothetical protein